MTNEPNGDYKFWFSFYSILTQSIPLLIKTRAEANILLFLGTRSITWKRLWIRTSIQDMIGGGKYPYEFLPLPITQPSAWRGIIALRERQTLFTFPERLYGQCYFRINWYQAAKLIQETLEEINGPCMAPPVRRRYHHLGNLLGFINRLEQERRTPIDENERHKRQKTGSDTSATG